MTTTYDSLARQVILIFERSDDPFVNLIPNFVEQAHQRIARDAISLEMILYAKGNFISGNNYITKPLNWRRPLALKVIIPGNINQLNQYQVIEWRSYEFCREYFPCDGVVAEQFTSPPTCSPVPLFYSDYGREYLLLSPTPAINYQFELSFYGIVPSITPDLQTNFLTDYAPTLLLYATLLEACTFIKVDERIPVWQGAYSAALDAFNKTDNLAKEDRQTNRDRD